MDGYRIRRATNDDREAVVALVRSILGEYGQPLDYNTSDADLLDIERSYDSTGGILLLAVDEDDRLLGSVGLVGTGEATAKLRKMYVSAESRGRGLGKVLLHHLLKSARERGFRSITLETMNTMAAAMHLYESAGFKRIDGVPDSPRCHFVYKMDL